MESAYVLAQRIAIRKKVWQQRCSDKLGTRNILVVETSGQMKCKTCGKTRGWPLPCSCDSILCQGYDCYHCSDQHNQILIVKK